MRLPNRTEAALLRRAIPVVARVRAQLWLRGFGDVRRRIAERRADTPAALADMREIAWSVRAAARLIPGATCLTQALSGQALLAARGRRSQVEITLVGDASGETTATPRPHAWLLCGDVVVLGGTAAELRTQRTIATFRADGATRPAARIAGGDG